MKQNDLLTWILLAGSALLPGVLNAQAGPTATRDLQLSAFVLTGDRYTGLGGPPGPTFGLGGRNVTLTAGVDLGFFHTHHTTLAAEVRGSYPLFEGYVDGQKSISGGLRVERNFAAPTWSRVHPYVDVLAGRGEIHYVNGGFPVPPVTYLTTPSTVIGGGGGIDFDITARWALRGDAYFEHWRTPVTADGTILSKQGSGGIVYRFGTGSKVRVR